ncbi:MAG TPA: Ig-like domain-containing protein [Longimicrobiaceae bacterium]|nr:Ig-like domain-containing protein [Longimicrobiaceae bacterium]
MPRYVRLVLALSTLLALNACAGSPTASEPGEWDMASLRVAANIAGTPISTLVITVTAPDIRTPLVYNLEVVGGTAEGTLEIPAGAARTFTGQAFDTSGEVTHEGSETIDVNRGSNPPLSIALVAKHGEIEIAVSMGDYSVVVDPASATLDAGLTQELSAKITAPDGSPVSGGASWATLNPAIATVNADGLVMAVAAGTVDIVATYGGVAGKCVITVNGK